VAPIYDQTFNKSGLLDCDGAPTMADKGNEWLWRYERGTH